MYDGQIVEKGGLRFRINIEFDDDADAPWENDDGTGIVPNWTVRDKRPGERILNTDHGSKRFYDFAGTMEKARAEGWGLSPERIAQWTLKAGQAPTPSQIIEAAVEADFERLRRWCSEQWWYVGVIVTQIDENDEPKEPDYLHAIWCMESDDEAGHEEYANEYMDQIIAERKEAELLAAVEAVEVAYWNARGVLTK
jgi:hypothetical protein